MQTQKRRSAVTLATTAFTCMGILSWGAPADRGTLIPTVVDEKTGENLPCRVYLVGSDGKAYFPQTGDGRDVVTYEKQRGQSVTRHATVGARPFRAILPAGKARVVIERGKEYVPLIEDVEIVAGRETRRTFRLRRWINMAERGWYSGDTHTHRSLAELPNVMLAEDLNVAFPLEQWVTKAYTPPAYKPPAPAVARRAVNNLYKIDDTHVVHLLNCEYEIFTVGGKSHTLGAIMIMNAQKPFTAGAPPIGPIAADAHRQGALLDLDKHNWPWSSMLVPVTKVDLFELANNHVWRVKPHFLTFGKEAPRYMNIEATARGWAHYGFQAYYALLNCGFRLRPTAGTASGVHPVPLGWSRVYAKVDGPFTYEKWIESLRAGRSFVTCGPMLFLTVEGREPGATIPVPNGERSRGVRVVVDAEYARPVESVEIIVNGDVAKTFKLDPNLPADRGHKKRLECSVVLGGSSWIAARCSEIPIPDNYRFAHTGPVYVRFGDEPLRPRKREIDWLVQRTREELERNRGVLRPAELAEFEQALEVYRGIAARAQRASQDPSESKIQMSPEEEFTRMLAESRKAYDKVDNYTATFYKVERIDGELLAPERATFKFKKPYAVYLKWIEGPNEGTQAMYVRGKNRGRLWARTGGLLSFKTFRLDPKGKVAMKGNRHPITEAGIGFTLDLLETQRKRAAAAGVARAKRLADDPKASPRGVRFELTLNAARSAGYYCRRAVVTFDPANKLVTAVQIYDWNDQLIEDYRFSDLRINPGLTDRDFDPKHPDYRFE